MISYIEIAGLILIILGVLYIFLKAMGKFSVSEKEEDEIESKIFTLKGNPGIILVGLGVLLLVIGMTTGPSPPLFPAAPTPTAVPTVTSTRILVQNNSFTDCFPGIPENRTRTIEEGSKDLELFGPLESKDEPILIKFTDNGMPIGLIEIFFYSNSQIFKIEKVVDQKCQQIEEYSNIARGGDKHVLQNWDSLQIRFGDNNYDLQLGYGTGVIEASFSRTI